MPVSPQFKPFDPDAQVSGHTLRALLHGIRDDIVQPFLHEHELNAVDPEGWYPVRDVLSLFNVLALQEDAIPNFVSMGIKVSSTAARPPDLPQLPAGEGLIFANQIYQTNHQGDVGEMQVEKLADQHFKITIRAPYPDDVFYGIYYGALHTALPPATPITLYYDPDIPRRDQGGEVTILHATWG